MGQATYKAAGHRPAIAAGSLGSAPNHPLRARNRWAVAKPRAAQIGGSARVLPELLHHSAFGERATVRSVSGCSWSHGPGRLVTRCRRR
jgi:hypothetical protein